MPSKVDALRLEKTLLLVVGSAIFGFSFQQVSMNPTIPALQETFHSSTEWSTWLLTGFLLFGSVATPLIGRLADQFNPKLLLQFALSLFAIGSIGAACAPNMGVLIGCRSLCGVSGVFVALGISLIAAHVRPDRAGAAVGTLAASLAAGNVAGIFIAPLLTDYVSWRLMFVITAGTALISLKLSRRGLPDVASRARTRVDVAGGVLLAVAIASLMLGLTQANTWGWDSTRIIALFGIAVMACACWVVTELRLSVPMVDLRMLTRRTVMLTNTATLLVGAGVFASLVLVGRLVATSAGPDAGAEVTYGFGANSTVAGLYLAPAMLMGLAAALVLNRTSSRLGWKAPLIAQVTLVSTSLLLLAIWHDHPWQIVVAMLLLGPAMTTSSTTAKLIADDVRREEVGVAASLNMVMYYIGGVLGAQGTAAILSAHTYRHTAVPTEAAFSASFYVLAALGVLSLSVALLIRSQRATSTPVAHPVTADALSKR